MCSIILKRKIYSFDFNLLDYLLSTDLEIKRSGLQELSCSFEETFVLSNELVELCFTSFPVQVAVWINAVDVLHAKCFNNLINWILVGNGKLRDDLGAWFPVGSHFFNINILKVELLDDFLDFFLVVHDQFFQGLLTSFEINLVLSFWFLLCSFFVGQIMKIVTMSIAAPWWNGVLMEIWDLDFGVICIDLIHAVSSGYFI